jgi:hypothetical protein
MNIGPLKAYSHLLKLMILTLIIRQSQFLLVRIKTYNIHCLVTKNPKKKQLNNSSDYGDLFSTMK